MAAFLPDTSCMVAAVCGWHVEHEAAVREIKTRLARGESLVLAAPSLVEAYAVLSRLPPPRRLTPAASWELIRASFVDGAAKVVALEVGDYKRLLEEGAARAVAGGAIYDAIIVACAVAARAEVILTFNERHFHPLAPPGIRVVVPTA